MRIAYGVPLVAAAMLFVSLMGAQAQAPSATSTYLPVEDLPPPRDTPAMTADERLELKKDLTAARDRQAAIVKARDKSSH